MTKYLVTRSRLVWVSHEAIVEAESESAALEAAKEQNEWELIPDSGHGEGEPTDENYHVGKYNDDSTY